MKKLGIQAMAFGKFREIQQGLFLPSLIARQRNIMKRVWKPAAPLYSAITSLVQSSYAKLGVRLGFHLSQSCLAFIAYYYKYFRMTRQVLH